QPALVEACLCELFLRTQPNERLPGRLIGRVAQHLDELQLALVLDSLQAGALVGAGELDEEVAGLHPPPWLHEDRLHDPRRLGGETVLRLEANDGRTGGV